ncbi:sigma-70 family RNA polymerase sigma factor [Clostridium neuense]|uniref:Sigma-70 family RNA polymerase sigma factor n=1 Tax=Clostridium neuense TaxID=1728934 RepID=A0ABW8TGV1_9CLOT
MNENIEDIVYKAKCGDDEAKKFVIEYSSRYLDKILNYFCKNNKNLPREDLKQDGIIGIMKAINSYDNNKKVRFSTHVYNTIKYTLISQIKNKYTLIKIPEHVVSRIVTFKRKREKLRVIGYAEEDICCKMKMHPSKYNTMLRLVNLNNVVSLNSEVFKNEKTEFLENLIYEDINYIRVDNKLYLEFLQKKIESKLSDLEKHILIKSIVYNIPIKSISKEINIPSKKISELKYLALKKLHIKNI